MRAVYAKPHGKTCLRLVEMLVLSVTMTGNFCSIFNDVTGHNLEIISGMKIFFA